MGTRIITGLILAASVLAVLYLAPPWAIAGVIIVVAGLCVGEVVGMFHPNRRSDRVAAVAGAVAMLAGAYFAREWILHIGAAAFLIAALVVLLDPEPLERAGARLLTIWGSWLYIGVPIGFALTLTVNPHFVLLPCVVVFSGDTGAYFAGRALGKHKLYELISPKKTREGAVGGLLASALFAVLVQVAFIPQMSIVTAVLLGLGGGMLGQTGDLVESLLKRSAGVKDSGDLLPGHGGMLDRVDGLMLALPLFGLVLPALQT